MATTIAYCLLPNHFHLLVYKYLPEEQRAYHERYCGKESFQLPESWQLVEPRLAFKNLFISHSMAANRMFERTGSLFEKPFRRKRVENRRYFVNLVTYIHRNPELHGLVADFRDWPWSSYGAILSEGRTRVQRETVLGWYGGRRQFVDIHKRQPDERELSGLLEEDW